MAVLQTARLLLREMTLEDVDKLLDIFTDPEAMRYYPSTKTRAETAAWIDWNRRSYGEQGFGLWIAELRTTGEFAGQCGLVAQEVSGRQEVEIGYLFLRRFWGQGLATEAARASRDHGFGQFGRARLISLIAPANTASRRVAEKTGLRLEGVVEWRDQRVCLYAIERAHPGLGTNAGHVPGPPDT